MDVDDRGFRRSASFRSVQLPHSCDFRSLALDLDSLEVRLLIVVLLDAEQRFKRVTDSGVARTQRINPAAFLDAVELLQQFRQRCDLSAPLVRALNGFSNVSGG